MDVAVKVLALLLLFHHTFPEEIEKTIVHLTSEDANLSNIILQLNDLFHPKVEGFRVPHPQRLIIYSASVSLRTRYLERLEKELQGKLHISTTEKLESYKIAERVIRTRRSDEPPINLNNYNTYENILRYLVYVSRRYSELCTLYSIGQTYEGREIHVLKISATLNETRKPKIFIEAGQHAREWISPAATLYFINMILEEYMDDNEVVSSFVEHYELHVLPLLNPDGYVHTYSENGERLWRKNRKPSEFCDEDTWLTYEGNTSDIPLNCPCLGVDLNRNWDYQWGGIGGSNSWCSAVFRGKSIFSEEETTAAATYISSHTGWHSYFSLHSFGQLILLPWSQGHRRNPEYVKLMNAGKAFARGIRLTSNNTFTVGATGDIIYNMTGTSKQWAYRSQRFPYAYTIELTKYGFIRPPKDIASTSLELLNGLLAYLDYIEWNDDSYKDFLEGLSDTSTVLVDRYQARSTMSNSIMYNHASLRHINTYIPFNILATSFMVQLIPILMPI